MKLVASLAGLGLFAALLGVSAADDKPADPKPTETTEPTDAHFLEKGELFFVGWPPNQHKKGQIHFGFKTQGESQYEGAKLFANLLDEVYSSKEWFKTRIAKPEDLHVGRRIIYPMNEIKTRADTVKALRWYYGYVANVGDAPKGTVVVAGRELPEAEHKWGIRIILNGDPDPKITLTGKEDAHYFHPEHWLIYTDSDTPDADGQDTKMALQLKAPEKPGEEGTYLRLDNGYVVKTKYAYKSRPATKADLKAGLRIAVPERPEVPDRDRAYEYTWWVGALTSYDNGIAKLQNSTVRVEALRVIE